MAKAILICGKICCGKSTYAKRLRGQSGAVILSIDEIMLALFGQHAGKKHDDYVKKTEDYLLSKSLEIIGAGIDVILDWGFWTKAARMRAKAFYHSSGISCEFHYLDVSDEVWLERISARNRAVLAGEDSAYFIDEPLAKKFGSLFEPPTADEIDRWIKNGLSI